MKVQGRSIARLGFGLVCLMPLAIPQSQGKGRYYASYSIPSFLRQEFEALGNRLEKPGNERITLNGSLTEQSGAIPVVVLLQNGRKVRIDIVGDSSRSVRFDGKTLSGSNPSSNKVLESLVDDLPETLMEAVGSGAAVTPIGRRFPVSQGRYCDYYEMATPSAVKRSRPTVIKRFCFDSATRLLHFVQYRDGKGGGSVVVEVTFSDWRRVNGQAVPGRIVRKENGNAVFTFVVATASTSAANEDSVFRQ